jgi:magnesium transporter
MAKANSNNNLPAIFLSSLLRKPVYDMEGATLGRLIDVVADLDRHSPLVTGIIISGIHKPRLYLPSSCISLVDPDGLLVSGRGREFLTQVNLKEGELLLKDDLLDRQIVDTAGAKVVRVNDLQLTRVNGGLILSGVDVGLRGLMRRVGLEGLVEGVLHWMFSYTLKDSIIKWHLMQPVGSAHILRLKLAQSRLSSLHPADLADIIEDLDGPERARLLKALDIEIAAETLEETDPDVQVTLIQNLTTEHASDILEQMSPDEATDILQSLHHTHAETLLREMEPEQAENVRSLLEHDEETAGGLMTTSFLKLSPGLKAGQSLELLRSMAADLDVVYYGYVVDQSDRLLGVINLRELLIADPNEVLDAIMITRVTSIELDAGKKQIAGIFTKYGLRAIPVVDEQGCIQGVLRFKAILEAVSPQLGR